MRLLAPACSVGVWVLAPWLGSLAQSPAPAPLPASATASPNMPRLQQLEGTYQSNLRIIDLPILQEYLRELDTLKQSLTSQSRPGDAAKVETEIARVKQLGATTGILTYDPPKPPRPAERKPPVEDQPRPRRIQDRLGSDAIVLSAIDALSDTQAPPDFGAQAKASVLPLGQASWKVPRLAAGSYEVMVLYACTKVDPGRTITVKVNGSTLSHPLATDRATPSDQNFRILRLGQIVVDKDASNALLTLQANASGPPPPNPFWIRSVMLSHPKPKPKAAPAKP